MPKFAPAQISKALDQFPFIKQLIGIERLLSIAEKDHASPIIYYLSKSLPDESQVKELFTELEKDPEHIGVLIVLDAILEPYHILKHLDNCLSKIRGEKKVDVFLDHILDSKSFWQGYSEIEVASNLKGVFGTIHLEPTLPNGKSADIMFPLNSENVFVEVTAPKKGHKYISALEKSAESGKAVELPGDEVRERASDKILTELEHFANVLDQVPSVIIINVNQSDFDDLDIEEALMGESKLVVQIDRSKGKELLRKIERADWTAFKRNSKLAKVGAIISYKRDFDLLGRVVYNKRIFAISFTVEKCELLSNLF